MRLLVTGGTGVIGSRVVSKLVTRGIGTIVLDSRADFSLMPGMAGRFRFLQGDVTAFEPLAAAVCDARADRIIHLAAFIDPEMERLPFHSFDVNTRGTVHMLEAARLCGVKRFVAASSRAVYGSTPRGVGAPGYRPISEDHPKSPVSAYDVTKLAAEQMGQLYRNVYGIEYAALRFAGTYGPGKQARHGKMSLRSRIVEDPFAGHPVRVPQGGEQIDDMVYVDDVAEALVLAALAERLPHAAYNIASGRGQTMRDLADAVRSAIPGADIEIGPGLDPMALDVHYYAIFDIKRAREDFGYVPRFDLHAGVADYLETLRRMDRGS